MGLINARFIKPLDEIILQQLNNRRLIIIEEVVPNGSLATMIAAFILKNNLNIACESYQLSDKYPDIGTSDEIKKTMGIDIDTIIKKIQ